MNMEDNKYLTWRRLIAIGLIALVTTLGCSSSDDDDDDDMNTEQVDGGNDTETPVDDTSPDDNSGQDNGEETPTSLTISGQAVANPDDASQVATLFERVTDLFADLNPFQFVWAAADTGAADNTALSGATVTLHKVFGDSDTADETVDIGTVTTDSDGNFTIPDIELAPAGSGADTDFYYEVRITKGDLQLRSPAAPREDATVNVSPETDVAAKIISDVVNVPGVNDPPLAMASTIESIRELVIDDAATLVDEGAIEIPSAVGVNAQDNVLALANGVSAGGGNAEKMFKAASFEAEYLALTAGETGDTEQAAGFISRVTRESCGQAEGEYMPQALADALGDYYFNGDEVRTLTPSAIITAYNANIDTNGGGTQLDLATVVSNYQAMLSSVEDNLEASASESEDISDEDQVVMLTKRDLEADTFSATTELTADQVAAFIQTLASQNCSIDSRLDLFGFMADLLGDQSLRQIAIANSQIYHNSGFGCNEGDGEGHFYADIQVYRGTREVDSVTISSSDSTALDGDGTITLTQEGNSYKSNTNGVCVALGTEVTYTITVNFTTGSPVVGNVVRNHPRIPEASSTVFVDGAFVAGADNSASPTVVDTTRPLYQWTSPADMLTDIINDSSNSAISSSLSASSATVKYTYEFAHVDTSATQVGPASDPACPIVSSGALYAVDSFIPTEDCDVTACAAALGIAEEDVACRMNIQSYLVNEHDKILGQAAGHFRFFCVDIDNDGDCG